MKNVYMMTKKKCTYRVELSILLITIKKKTMFG